MRLLFLGKDSTPGESPTLYRTDADSYIVQGWIVSDPDVLALLTLTDDETVVEVTPKLMDFLTEDGRGPVRHLVPPIVHVLENSNYIVRGTRVTDPETLAQMNIPDHETCVLIPVSTMLLLTGG
ncbi:hypothetical protein LO762_02955 [Actinocorallia sp. API 0066]|uniref:hypothetical protein n=1 Tax=Actinocorallia sp. API 0066 TaxID=2896846 RepID=UPI001E44FA6C|nr:hypothetical protein [Actinocorallia sp. API 0066]MCD0448160.1 hypothetical protein [Actinocorallia sp. API 0066]